MPRNIDKLPVPAKPKKMRVVVASCSRTGTLGFYHAMKTLGFTPYHLSEVLHKHGIEHMRVFQEAVLAQRHSSRNRPYNKEDFARWLGEYDCLIEIPSYLGTGALETFAEDPDIRFILIERDPSKWLKSMNNTTARAIQMGSTFPLNILKFFDEEMYSFLELNKVLYGVWSEGTSPGSPENERALRHNYIEYITMAKRALPEERLLVLKLEEGLGWEQICPFLGLPVPDAEYPCVRNEPERFQRAINRYLWRRARVAAFRLGSFALPISVIAGYLWWTLS